MPAQGRDLYYLLRTHRDGTIDLDYGDWQLDAYAHRLPDYNGHYGIRELCDICPARQLERCQVAFHRPEQAQVERMAAGLGATGVPVVGERAIIVEGLDEQRRYLMRHSLGYQVQGPPNRTTTAAMAVPRSAGPSRPCQQSGRGEHARARHPPRARRAAPGGGRRRGQRPPAPRDRRAGRRHHH